MITTNLNNLLSALAPAAAPQAAPVAVLGAQSMRFDAALLEAAKTVRDGSGQSVERTLTPKVAQALQGLFDQLAQKSADQLRQWASQPAQLKPVVEALAQAQGLSPDETTELKAMAPLAVQSLVQALDGSKVETASVAKLETPGNISGPQGREPGTPADPATTFLPSAPLASLSEQPLTLAAVTQAPPTVLAPLHPAKDERSTFAQAAAMSQVAAWVPTIVSTRTDGGWSRDSAVSLSSQPVAATAGAAANAAATVTVSTSQTMQSSKDAEAAPAAAVQAPAAVQEEASANAAIAQAPQELAAQPVAVSVPSNSDLDVPVSAPAVPAAPGQAAVQASSQAPQAPSARNTVERAPVAPRSEAELNLDFKISAPDQGNAQPAVESGTLFVLKGDGSTQGSVTVAPSAPAAAQAQPSSTVPQGPAATAGQALPALQTAVAFAPSTTPTPPSTMPSAPTSTAPQQAPAPGASAQAAVLSQQPVVAQAQLPVLTTVVAAAPQAFSVDRTVTEPPKGTATDDAASTGPSGPSSALENSAGFQALKRGSQEDAPQPGLNFGQEALRNLASQVTKELGIRDAAFKQVSDAIADASAETNRLVIKLKPANLGEVQVDLTVEGGKVTAKLLASTPEVRDAFVRDLPAFKANLEAQGLRIDQLSVAVRSGSSSTAQGQSQGRPQGQPWDLQRAPNQAGAPVPSALPSGAWASPALNDQRFSALA